MKKEKKLRIANAKQGLTGEATATSTLPVSDTCNEKGRYVIENLDVANKVFTTKYLYANSRMRQETRKESINRDVYSELKSNFSSEFDNVNDGDCVIWEERSRRRMAQQPFTGDKIIKLFQLNNNASCSQQESSACYITLCGIETVSALNGLSS